MRDSRQCGTRDSAGQCGTRDGRRFDPRQERRDKIISSELTFRVDFHFGFRSKYLRVTAVARTYLKENKKKKKKKKEKERPMSFCH